MIRIFYLFALMTLNSCNETLIKGEGSSFGGIINVSSIGFADVDREIFQARCTSCHGNAGGVNLQGYANVKANANRAMAAINSGRMPPGAPLSSRAKQLLALWISKGMPLDPVIVNPGEGGGEGGEDDSPTLPPLSPTYASLKEHIFSARCTSCHSSNSRLVPLTTREEIINPRADLVDFNNPERSLLLQVIKNRSNPQQVTHDDDDQGHDDDDNLQMPPVTSGISPVPQEHIQALEEWIRRGAPE